MADACSIILNEGLAVARKTLAEAKIDTPGGDTLRKRINKIVDDVESFIKKADVSDKDFKYAEEFLAKELVRATNDLKALDRSIGLLKKSLNRKKNTQGYKAAVADTYQNTQVLINGEETWLANTIKDIVDTLYERVPVMNLDKVKFKSAFLNELKGGTKMEKLLREMGVEDVDKELFKAAKNGHHPDNSILNMIAKTYKQVDEVVKGRIDSHGSVFKGRQDYVMKVSEDFTTVRNKGKDAYFAHMKKVVDFEKMFERPSHEISDAKINEWIEGRWQDSRTSPSSRAHKTTKIDHAREIVFKNDDMEYLHYKEYSDPKRTVFNGMFGHKADLLRKSKTQQLLGSDLDLFQAEVKGVIAEKVGHTTDVVEKLADKLAINTQLTSNALANTTNEVAATLSRAVSSSISAGLTQLSVLRNIFFDNSIHSAIVKSALEDGSILKNVMTTTWGLMKNLGQRGKTKELARLLELQGLMIEISGASITKGEFASGYVRASRNINNRKIYHKAADVIGELEQWTSTWGGMDATVRASRVQHALGSMKLINEADVDSLTKAFSEQMNIAGITKADLEAIKASPDILHDGIKIGKDIKDRDLHDKYNLIVSNMTNDLAAMTTAKGSILAGSLTTERGPLSLITKFYGITLSQYRALLRNTRLVSGLDPDSSDIVGLLELAKTPTGLRYLTAAGVLATKGGLMRNWTKDLLEGREPRDLTPEAVLDGFMSSGLGGIHNIAAQNIMYARDIVQTPLGSTIRDIERLGKGIASGDSDKIKTATHKAVKRLPIGANLWFTSGAVDALFYKGLDTPKTTHSKTREREAGNPHRYRTK